MDLFFLNLCVRGKIMKRLLILVLFFLSGIGFAKKPPEPSYFGGNPENMPENIKVYLLLKQKDITLEVFLKKLEDAEWNIDAQDQYGTTALHLVASFGDLKKIELIIKAGANKLIADNKGFTPLTLCYL